MKVKQFLVKALLMPVVAFIYLFQGKYSKKDMKYGGGLAAGYIPVFLLLIAEVSLILVGLTLICAMYIQYIILCMALDIDILESRESRD
jgi:hypothetical protein